MKTEAIIDIHTESIRPDPENLRKTFDEADIQALAENISEHGQLDPISVFRREDGSYDLWDGERRWRACRLMNKNTMRAIVVPKPTPVDLLCKKISRAMQTRTLGFQEEVRALEEGLRALGVYDNTARWTWAAKKLGILPSLLRERMRITKLSPNLRAEFEAEKLDYSTAQTLGKIEDVKRQEQIAEFVQREDLSNRFAVLSFIPTALEHPKKSLLEAYDLAKQREREKYRYAKPRKEEVPRAVVERIDEMLADFRKCEGWLEAAGKEGLIQYLLPQNFNTKRLLNTFRTVHAMLSAFLTAYEAKKPKKPKPTKALPVRSLLEGRTKKSGKKS
jgi:ParB/RepB/Spo0J family partition protein